MEIHDTFQEASSQRPLLNVCFSGRSVNKDDCSSCWLAKTFSTSPLQPQNRIWQNLTGSKYPTSSTKFVGFFVGKFLHKDDCPGLWLAATFFLLLLCNGWLKLTKLDRKQVLNILCEVCVFGLIGQQRWFSWHVIGRAIFSFSATTAQNVMKLDKKPVLNVLYQFCV